MRIVIADSSPVKEMITFGVYMYMYLYIYIFIYFMVLHKSYVKLQPDQILCILYPVVYAGPSYL
jgi:hypothetical protein